MPLVINQSAHENQTAQQLIELCPFKAFDYVDGTLSINSSCRYCMQCVKSGPKGAISFMEEDNTPSEVIDKSMSRGICVVAEIKDSSISTVTFELLAKAKELASVIDHPVQVVVMGDNVGDTVNRLRNYA
ncbi:MAG: electron transfer flavoprotein subunit alpha, partial [Oscillospiraceae bacterium]|nr:electron transfer flavoprotein subunit alpha [Oscillospiraceae bacterium]